MIFLEIPIGDFFDKYSILCLKSERILDQNKLVDVIREKQYLESLMDDYRYVLQEECYKKLHYVNKRLWEIQDDMRECERLKCFDDRFNMLAKDVNVLNDKRFMYKYEINKMTNSSYKEQKSYSEEYLRRKFS